MFPIQLMRSLSPLGLLIGYVLCGTVPVQAQERPLWIGTTTPANGASRGIYRAMFDSKTGQLSQPELAAEVQHPGFIALHPTLPILYAVCQLPDAQEPGVMAWNIDPETHALTPQSHQPIGDGGATHLALDRDGRWLFTAQYGSGSVAMFRLGTRGEVLERTDLVRHSGSGPNPERQEKPHPHWVGTSPDNRFLFVPDLGIDQVMIYRIDTEAGRLIRHGAGRCPPGSGPRHLKFHPDRPWVYVLNELTLTVTFFEYEAETGRLIPVETVEALPADLQDIPNTASEIRIAPDGRFLYTANRGHDSISVFEIHSEKGTLRRVEIEAIRGAWPRNFNLDPSGRWLLAAGRDSQSITVFERDPKTGELRFTGPVVACPTPICLTFVPE